MHCMHHCPSPNVLSHYFPPHHVFSYPRGLYNNLLCQICDLHCSETWYAWKLTANSNRHGGAFWGGWKIKIESHQKKNQNCKEMCRAINDLFRVFPMLLYKLLLMYVQCTYTSLWVCLRYLCAF